MDDILEFILEFIVEFFGEIFFTPIAKHLIGIDHKPKLSYFVRIILFTLICGIPFMLCFWGSFKLQRSPVLCLLLAVVGIAILVIYIIFMVVMAKNNKRFKA